LKKNLRKKLINRRKENYSEINSNYIINIFESIKKNYKNIKVIGGYMPINFEFDCSKLLKFLETKNYTICLPVIKNNYKMNFYKYSFKDPLKVNKLGIPEPISSANKVVPDLIFVPLVGYDNNLNRLGYGGGFYDRYFEKNSRKRKIIKIGLAFSFQKIKKLPVNKFDKKINRIITEKKI
tara:strand:+ start:786 stop:1325 length:540 start_codon:yes stop_codon:yes gene_type:complete